jgi:molecular chaperone DnaK
VEIHVLQGERQMAEGNKSLGRFRLSGIPPAPRGVPQVQVSFDIDANGLLQVSATDRTTGRQQSVTIQGGSNLSEQEIEALLAEAEARAAEDRRRRATIDRRNRAQTLITQAERRLRDAALELGPYGAERQQRAVELAVRDVQDLLAREDDAELELAVSQLQESLFGLNRRLLQERRAESGPLQGLRNTLGSLKDELFSDDDDWDDWDRDGRSDPWASPRPRGGYDRPADRFGEERFGGRFGEERDLPDRYATDRSDSERFESARPGDRTPRDGYDARDRDASRPGSSWSDGVGGWDRREPPGRDRGPQEARWNDDSPAADRWADAPSRPGPPGRDPEREERDRQALRRPPVPVARDADSGRARGLDDDPWRDV